MMESYFESKLNHNVQRASPFLILCGFQDGNIVRVSSHTLLKSAEMLTNTVFPLFLFCVIFESF